MNYLHIILSKYYQTIPSYLVNTFDTYSMNEEYLLYISDMQLFEVECIIFPDIYTSLRWMDISPRILVSGQIKCLMFVWSQVQECVLGIFDTRLSHCT